MRRGAARQSLLVFARVPAAGSVKTRLHAALHSEDAARLYEAFVIDTLRLYREPGVDVRLYLAPSSDPVPPGFSEPDVRVLPQRGDDLGARLLHAFVETFAAGYERIVALGTDHPTLPAAFVGLAFEALREPLSICLGPADDGGYYLIGMNELYPSLFRDVTYSQPDVLEKTLEKAAATGANVTVLPPWYDVDTPADLLRLQRDLAEPGSGAVETRRVMAGLAERYPELRS